MNRVEFIRVLDRVGAARGVVASNSSFAEDFRFTTPGLPVLPFFTDLAKELNIDIEKITALEVDITQDYGSCETCGPGPAELNSIEWRVSL